MEDPDFGDSLFIVDKLSNDSWYEFEAGEVQVFPS